MSAGGAAGGVGADAAAGHFFPADRLPAWLEARRWFADKGRGVRGVTFEDALVERVAGDWLALIVARVEFRDGSAARYLLPLALTPFPGETDAIDRATLGAEERFLVDATALPWFGQWLLERMASPAPTPSARWTFAAHEGAEAAIAAARAAPATLLGGEQSNTSLRFGDALIVKIVRRLQPGPNPDEEVLRALAGSALARVPRFAGAASWRADDGTEHPIALAQTFVPNKGDGWSWLLRRLAEVAAGQRDIEPEVFAPERLLGRRTGELHVALSRIMEPAFAPEGAAAAAIAADARRTREAIGDAATLLHERSGALPAPLRAQLPAAIAALRSLAGRAEGFQQEAGGRRIRVHGDYHLGQVLRTPDGDWTIIDFEGEPARPAAERRRKTSALKDVAGMLRSFAYARGTAERDAADQEARERLARWESGARQAFLEGYRAALPAAAVTLAPEDDAAFAQALAAWELDKALYEIAYEARNRPDWLVLPLRTLIPEQAALLDRG